LGHYVLLDMTVFGAKRTCPVLIQSGHSRSSLDLGQFATKMVHWTVQTVVVRLQFSHSPLPSLLKWDNSHAYRQVTPAGYIARASQLD
jgi:hypothetical protein